KVKAEVAARGLSEKVIFTGHINNPMDHILSADLCVLPSIIEGLPGVVAESFYCRTPVVAYEVGGIKDLVENGENGWLIEQGNEHAFADKMMGVLKMDTIMKASVTDAAYKTVTQNFRNEVIALRFIDLYKSLQPLK
ncbi:MAG: glycosyltransferase, partial [Chitinophagaceae bacterium]